MKKNIYLIRHGESEENATGILADDTSPLSEKGLKEAEIVAERIKKLAPEVLFASHFKRAQQTAEAVSRTTGLPIETHDFIFETRYPSHRHGTHRDDPEGKAEALLINDKYIDEDYKHTDAESFKEIKNRGLKALELLASHPAQNIAVVSHGNFIRVLVGLALFGEKFNGDQYADMIHGFTTVNTGITWFTYKEGMVRKPWRILTWNDHNHLAETEK